MNPKNIEQYVVKSVIACMDLEMKLKKENEMLKKRLEFLEYVYYRLNDYEQLCLICSIEGCKALDMSEIREHLVYYCKEQNWEMKFPNILEGEITVKHRFTNFPLCKNM